MTSEPDLSLTQLMQAEALILGYLFTRGATSNSLCAAINMTFSPNTDTRTITYQYHLISHITYILQYIFTRRT